MLSLKSRKGERPWNGEIFGLVQSWVTFRSYLRSDAIRRNPLWLKKFCRATAPMIGTESVTFVTQG
jgi:hypothetical protein